MKEIKDKQEYENKLNNSILYMLEERHLYNLEKIVEEFIYEVKLKKASEYKVIEIAIKASGKKELDFFIDDHAGASFLVEKIDQKRVGPLIRTISKIREIKNIMADLAKDKLKDLPKIHYFIKYVKQAGSSKVKAKDIFDWNEFFKEFFEVSKFVKINNILKHSEENRLVNKEELHQAIHKHVYNIDSGLEQSIATKVSLSAPSVHLDIRPDLITFKNGQLNILTMEFTPGEFKTINMIPWDYNPDAKSPYGREIMDRYVGFNEGFDTQIFEVAGLMMLQDRGEKFKCAIFANGKSDYGKNFLFDHIIMPTIGRENVGLFNLSNLADATERTAFIHKTCVYDSDSNNNMLSNKSKDEFKRITGGNMVKAKILYKDLFDFENYATMWINCNGLPKINDPGSGGAVNNRLHVVQFTVAVKNKYYDPNIFARVKESQKEISEWMIAESTKAIHAALIKGELTKNASTNDALDAEYFEGDAFHRWATHYFGGIYKGEPIKADDLFHSFLGTFETFGECANINIGYKKDTFGRNWFVKNLRDNTDRYDYVWRDTYKQPNGTQTRSWVLPSGSAEDQKVKGAEKTFERIFLNDQE